MHRLYRSQWYLIMYVVSVQPMVLVFLVLYPPTWTRIYAHAHTRASSFDCTHSRCETIASSSSLSRYIPLLPLPPSLCQFLFHFFHCSLPDASHANSTVFASIIIILFFPLPSCFLISLHGLFIPFLLANLRDYPDSAPVFVLFFAPYFFSYISLILFFVLFFFSFFISANGEKCIVEYLMRLESFYIVTSQILEIIKYLEY